LSKSGNRFRLAEAPGVAGHTVHQPGVFVVDLALNHAMAKAGIVLGGWTKLPGLLRLKAHGQTERKADFSFVGAMQRLVRDPLQREAQENEADIAVFGVGTGIGGQGDLKSLDE